VPVILLDAKNTKMYWVDLVFKRAADNYTNNYYIVKVGLD
jgi:hypothetical protein